MKRKENTDKTIAKLKQIHAKCLLCCNTRRRTHHREYDSNHTHKDRVEWLKLKRLEHYAEKLQEFLGYAIV